MDQTRTRPRSVLVVDDRMYRELAQSPDSVELLEDLDAMVIPFSGAPEVHEAEVSAMRALLLDAGQLVPKALLVKNPYETESYEFAQHAIETFASAKYHHLANAARLLGAREIHFLEARAERDAASWSGAANVKVPAGGGSADISSEVSKKVEERLEGRMAFPGGAADAEAALAYLRRRRLSNDQQLMSLVEMRMGENPISDYKMTLSGTRESAANIHSALAIANAGPVKVADIGASFRATAETVNRIEITTEITF